MTPLERLKEGNKRYTMAVPHGDWSPHEQWPFAAILTCSDSRIPVETIFDQGPGSLFVVRLAGNVAGETALESLTFAVRSLHTPLIVVMGHQNCGAVQAALSGADLSQLAKTASLLTTGSTSSLKEAILANIHAQVSRITSHFSHEIQAATLTICGAYYDFETSSVTFL